MARKKIVQKTLLETLEIYGNENMTDLQKVIVARNSYLQSHQDEIIHAIKLGYPYPILAAVITEDLLKTDIPKTFTLVRENEEIEVDTKMPINLLKEFYEANLV